MSTVITIKDKDFETVHNALANATPSVGKHEFSKSIFARDGVNLRIEAFVQFEFQSVPDDEAMAARDAALDAKKQELVDAAAAAGLSLRDYKAKLKSEERVNRINAMVEEQGIDAEEAAGIVDAENAAEEDSKKADFMAYKQSVDSSYVFNEDDYDAWLDQQEYNNRPLITKKVVSVFQTQQIGVVYSFDENVTGIAGFNTIAKDQVNTVQYKVPTVEEFKASFKEYVESAEFLKGIAFVGRIAGDDIIINVE